MKRSMIQKVESLLSAIISGKTGETVKEIIHRPLNDFSADSKKSDKFKFIQLLH